MNIRRALSDDADVLSHIALSAKAHWGYPKQWMEIWRPQLTFSSEYFKENETWTAELNNTSIAFYTIQEK